VERLERDRPRDPRRCSAGTGFRRGCWAASCKPTARNGSNGQPAADPYHRPFCRSTTGACWGTIRAIEKSALLQDGFVMRHDSRGEPRPGSPMAKARSSPAPSGWSTPLIMTGTRPDEGERLFRNAWLKLRNDVGLPVGRVRPSRPAALVGNFRRLFSHIAAGQFGPTTWWRTSKPAEAARRGNPPSALRADDHRLDPASHGTATVVF